MPSAPSSEIEPAADLGLVRSIARAHARRGLDLDDLESAGKVGLMRAYERFDPAKSSNFVGYARRHIEGAIRDAIRDEARPIRVPRRHHRTVYDDPDPGDRSCVSDARRVLRGSFVGDHSLEEGGIAELIPDDASRGELDLAGRAAALIGELPELQAAVIRGLCGMDGKRRRAPTAVARSLGLSLGRLEELEAMALATLRHRLDDHELMQTALSPHDLEPEPMSDRSRLNGHLGNGQHAPGADQGAARKGWECPSCGTRYPKTTSCYKKTCNSYRSRSNAAKRRKRLAELKAEAMRNGARPAPAAAEVPGHSPALVELEVMAAIVAAMQRLRPAARLRALTWAGEVIKEMK